MIDLSTPGPWECRERTTPAGRTVHEVHQVKRHERHGTYRIATVVFKQDAPLLAAAPELRDALTALLKDYTEMREAYSSDRVAEGWDAVEEDVSAIKAGALLEHLTINR